MSGERLQSRAWCSISQWLAMRAAGDEVDLREQLTMLMLSASLWSLPNACYTIDPYDLPQGLPPFEPPPPVPPFELQERFRREYSHAAAPWPRAGALSRFPHSTDRLNDMVGEVEVSGKRPLCIRERTGLAAAYYTSCRLLWQGKGCFDGIETQLAGRDHCEGLFVGVSAWVHKRALQEAQAAPFQEHACIASSYGGARLPERRQSSLFGDGNASGATAWGC